MIEWQDEGALLSARLHGETSAILEVFTRDHGRVSGVLRGGASRKQAAHLQPGTQLSLRWKARLDQHLGSVTIEPLRGRAAMAFDDPLALSGLGAVTALLAQVLPEREPHVPLYQRTIALLDLLGQSGIWPLAYLHWEMGLLEELGFGLDLSACAATGVNEDLAFVSPKSGRAVSAQGAGEWAARLLPLPPVMVGKGDADGGEIVRALGTTGWFLEHRLLKSVGKDALPSSRARLLERIARSG